MPQTERTLATVLTASIDVLTWESVLGRIQEWASRHESRYVCLCNVHSVVTAGREHDFGQVIANADMATSDGMPVAWMLRHLGFPDQQRISGAELMWKYYAQAAKNGDSIYLYGGMPETLKLLQLRLKESFPELIIAGAYSPPFRQLTAEEGDAVVKMINDSGASTVWVSLGCPKQEKWMAAHRGRINAVMFGVGAAFDFHAGTIKRAPLWMHRFGLEWLHRLCSEPSRLWKRYLVTNTIFLFAAAKQLFLNKR